MSEKYKTIQNELYFSTCSIVGWADVFIRREYQEILIDSFNYCTKHKGLVIYDYCMMPSHFHWIAKCEDKPLNELLRDLKSFTANRIIECIKNNPKESRKEWLISTFEKYGMNSPQKQVYQFWKHDSHSLYLFSNDIIEQKRNYIHQNLVKAGFVNKPEEYRLSSANNLNPVILASW